MDSVRTTSCTFPAAAVRNVSSSLATVIATPSPLLNAAAMREVSVAVVEGGVVIVTARGRVYVVRRSWSMPDTVTLLGAVPGVASV